MIKSINSFIFNLIKSNIGYFDELNYYNDFIPKNTNTPYLYIENISIKREDVFNKNLQTLTNKIHIVNNEFYCNIINALKSNLLEILSNNNILNKLVNNNYKIIDIMIISQDLNTLISNVKVIEFIITFKVIVEVV